MLGRISGTGVSSLLNLMKPAPKPAGGKVASDDDTAGARSAQSQRAQDALEALNTMRAAVQNQKQQRKAAAKAKVDRLKKELETLRLMSGGDPKAVARRAAQIARELASAAKEYASSGGSGMAAGGTAQAGGADASAQAGEGADASVQAEAAQAGAAGGAAGTAGAQAQAEAKAAVAEADAAAKEAGETAQAAKQEKEPGAKDDLATDEDAQKLATETFQQMAADVARQGSEKKADSEFAAEVRRLMAAVKSIVAQARRRAEQTGEEEELDRLVKQVKQAEADMEESFSAAPEIPVMPVNIMV